MRDSVAPSVRPTSLVVVGTGLIGTSVALAARRRGVPVTLLDTDPTAVAVAVARGAGRPVNPDDPPADLAVVAVPPDALPEALRRAQERGLARAYTDVTSVKASIVDAVRSVADPTTVVLGHPMAGRERSGPAAASAELFAGRTWALCPLDDTRPEALAVVRGLVELCGARPVLLSPAAHDRAVALVSHVPRLVAGAMAAALARASVADLQLAGPGVRDVTRIAAADVGLWSQILAHNAAEVAAVAAAVAEDLRQVAMALAADPPDLATVSALLRAGQEGRAALDRAQNGGCEVGELVAIGEGGENRVRN